MKSGKMRVSNVKVIDADIHEFLVEGGTLLIYFTSETKITNLDGEEFIYDENPNAKDCGLPIGTVVKIYFDSVEYGNDGMADQLYAKEVIPQNESITKSKQKWRQGALHVAIFRFLQSGRKSHNYLL